MGEAEESHICGDHVSIPRDRLSCGHRLVWISRDASFPPFLTFLFAHSEDVPVSDVRIGQKTGVVLNSPVAWALVRCSWNLGDK